MKLNDWKVKRKKKKLHQIRTLQKACELQPADIINCNKTISSCIGALLKQGFMSEEFPIRASCLIVPSVQLRGTHEGLEPLIPLSTKGKPAISCTKRKHRHLLHAKAFQLFLKPKQ